jgi:Type II secretion system (T2SS), protein M subtype b
MGNLLQARQRFIALATVLGAICLALVVYLFWAGSGGPSREALLKQHDDLKRQVSLWQKSDPAKTRADLDKFYSENLPSRSSQISQRVDQLILESGVATQSIRYPADTSTTKNGLPDIEEIKVETNVTGDYAKVAKFINALEQDKMLFIIEKISLSGQQGGMVSLQISFSTFLKTA